jgi:hypothetical protein
MVPTIFVCLFLAGSRVGAYDSAATAAIRALI